MVEAFRWVGASAVAGLALIAVLMSASINWRFGFFHLGGHALVQAHTIATLLVVVDIFKAVLPIVIGLMWASGKWAPLRCILLLVLIGISCWASFEVNGQGREQGVAAARVERSRLAGLRKQYSAAESELAALPRLRPVAMILADIEAIKLERRWHSSAGCTDATATKSIAYCKGYRRLEAELFGANRAEHLRQMMHDLAPRIEAATTEQAVTEPSAAVAAIARWLGLDLEQIITTQVLILAVVLEIAGAALPGTAFWVIQHIQRTPVASSREAGAGKGEGIEAVDDHVPPPSPQPPRSKRKAKKKTTSPASLATGREGGNVVALGTDKDSRQGGTSASLNQPPSATQAGSLALATAVIPQAPYPPPGEAQVAAFIDAVLVPSPGRELRARDLWARYHQWCAGRQQRTLAQNTFGKILTKLLDVRKRKSNGAIVYSGLTFAQQ